MYQFAVKAVNIVGDSVLSASIAIRAAQAPDAPNAPTKKSSTLTSITIQWSPPSFNGGNAISSYKVYIDDGLGGSLTYLATHTTLTSLEYTATGLFNSRLYHFTVSAINLINESEQSESTAILAAIVPEAPAKPITVSQSSTQIQISWNEPENNGSNIDDYRVFMCTGTDVNCSFVPVAASTSGSTSYLAQGLAQGNYFQFRVEAHNSIGYSAKSEAHIEVAADPPSQPDSPVKD